MTQPLVFLNQVPKVSDVDTLNLTKKGVNIAIAYLTGWRLLTAKQADVQKVSYSEEYKVGDWVLVVDPKNRVLDAKELHGNKQWGQWWWMFIPDYYSDLNTICQLERLVGKGEVKMQLSCILAAICAKENGHGYLWGFATARQRAIAYLMLHKVDLDKINHFQ